MSTYYCECCNYYAKQKSNYVKHLTTKKHINMSLKNSKIKVNDNKDKDNNIYNCIYCDRIFKHRSSLSRHLRGSCKHNKKENYQELADLMNEKDQIIEKNMKLIDKKNNL